MDPKKWQLISSGGNEEWRFAFKSLPEAQGPQFARAAWKEGVWHVAVNQDKLRVALVQTKEGAQAEALIRARRKFTGALLEIEEALAAGG